MQNKNLLKLSWKYTVSCLSGQAAWIKKNGEYGTVSFELEYLFLAYLK